MTKIKKVVAMALAFLMIFSSASVLANAWTVTVDDGFDLSIGTKFFINNGTDWVETEKVAPGSTVKARVYIGTDYYSNSSTLLFFYDKDFFTHSYISGQNDLSVNPEIGAFTGKLNPTPVLNSQVSAGYIDSAFLDEYAAISVNLFMPSGSTNAMYDDSTWIFEFDLTVADTARGEGDLFVKDTTVQNSTSQNKALVNVPKGPEGGTNADVWPMWRWNANVTLTSQPVSTVGSVIFDANGGQFADGEEEAVVGEYIGETVTVPAAPERNGYTFIGWIDAADTTPTYEEAQATVPVANVPYDAVTYNAFWIKNVNITFDTDGGSEIPAHENVTPYTEFAAVAAPTKAGYTFVGWDVRGNMTLPATYPDVNTTYTAIWAKDVVVSFDTNGAEAIESIPGVAGEDFEAVIADPSKEGHWFVKWSPALPTVFPEADTTYKAIFETRVYPVYYYVEGKNVSNVQVEYGAEIPTVLGTVIAPEGMKLSAWYTDAAMENEFVAGTVMGTAPVTLYAEYEYETYNAIFDANGGKFADGNTTVTVPTVYLDDVVAPAAPTKVGYVFAGWTPYAEDIIFDEPNDMYFYATWNQVERNVEYYADGEEHQVFELNTGDVFEIPADPYKEGYTFLGWAETEGGAVIAYEDMPATMPELAEGETLKYYAVFEINEYTITWDVDGDITEKTYNFDEAIDALADPTKAGYTFAGWANEADEIVTVPEKMPAKNVNLKATWTIETYTLKFDTVGGNEIGDIVVEYNENIIDRIPANPTKEGHTFTGWNEEIPTVIPDLGNNGAEKLFTATWSTNSYNVTWIVPDQENQVDTVVYGEAITAPVPVKEGYVFAGWDAEIPATMPAEDLTFTGSWNPATDTKYTVNIHTMNADGTYTTETAVLEGTTEEEVTAQYTVENGFEFNAEKSTVTGVVAADGSLVLDVYIDRKTVTISFNTDGGTAVDAISGLYGAAVNATEEPTKKGYQFAGWENIPATFPAENAEVKATWTAKTFDATFNANGGQFEGGAESVEVATVFNEAIVAPADPTMKGHKFEGWTPSVGNMTEEGMAFTAVWSKVTYDATFMVDGEVYATVPTVFGDAIVAPANPTKAGYTFAGWTPSVGNMTEEGMTFTGSWLNATDTKYSVTVYTMNTDGTYGEGVTNVYAGETNTEATAEGKYTISEGFQLNAEKSVLKDTIAADSSTVLEVYIDRLSYDVTTDVEGTVSVADTVLFGATVAEPAAPSKTGYTFAGWEGYTAGMTMPVGGVALKATWTKNTDTAYKVVVTYKDVKNGGNIVTEENTFTGTTENAIEIVAAKGNAANTEYVLYKNLISDADYLANFDVDTAASTTTGTVAADGSTVLNITFVPKKYDITFDAGEGAFADGSTTYIANVEYYSVVGDAAPAEEPTQKGYTFGGWRNAGDPVTGARKYAAIWTINQYTITFDTVGGNAIAPITQDYNTAVAAPEDPTKTGYTFTGWDKEIPATMPAEDMTITATWSINSYSVTWKVEGEADKVDTVVYGEAITAPVPVKEGYVFAGWDAEIPATMPAEDLVFNGSWNPATDTKYTVNIHTMNADGTYATETAVLEGTTEEEVTAQYTVENGFEFNAEKSTESGVVAADGSLVLDVYIDRKTITISFNTNGGTAVDAISGLYGAATGTPAETTKTGYTFAGWSPAVPATFPAADTSVTAQWTINSYAITFNAGEGTFADGSKEKVEEFDYNTTPVAPETPNKVGYTFIGWTPDFAPVTGEATYTAQFAAGAVNYTVETYTMDTEGNYGSPVKETKGGTADTKATVVPAAKTGFTVAPESVLEDTIKADGSTVLKVYYARNQYDFTVIVDNDTTTAKYYYEAAVAAPAAPSKTGYTFAGWDAEVPATMPANDVTIKATWTVNEYTVTWKVEGEADKVETYDYSEAITKYEPTKTGYVFSGWDAEIPATMPAEDLVFNGSWNPATDTKYTVNIHTMNADGTYTTETAVLEGTTEEEVTAQYTVENGFEFNAEKSTESGVVAADGSLVLNVYIDRKTITISFNTDGGTAVDALSGLYGAPVGTPAETTKTGYEFAGWSPAVPATFPAADETITAQWTLLSFTLNYRYNGIYATYEVPFGTAAADMPVPEDPAREGYTFTGWSELPATMPADTVNINPNWAIESYTVNFDADGGTVDPASVTKAYNEAIALPTPSKTGFVFNGWVDAEGNAVNYTKMPDLGNNGDVVTYKATWANATDTAYTVEIYTMNADDEYEVVTATKYGETGADVTADYTVAEGFTFNAEKSNESGKIAADGSTVLKVYLDRNFYTLSVTVDGATTTSEVLYGAAINVADPEKEGFTFAGWTPDLPATMPVDGVAVTATWTVNNYTVTWKVEGEADKVETYAYGADITEYAPVKEGYVFSGWTPAVPETMPAKNLEFTGSWLNATDTKYTVTVYTMNTDGTYTEATNTYTGETNTEATAEGKYTISEGFQLNAEKSVLKDTIAADSSTELIVYIDRIEYNFTVIVDEETTSTKVLYGASVSAPADPAKEGYTFAGWDAEVPATMPANDVTIKATWTVNEYTVTWKIEGEADKVETYDYSEAITKYEPTKTGYVFSGWDAEIPATMPAEDLVFNGSWNPATDTKYTVNIHTMGLDGTYTTETAVLEGTTEEEVTAQYTVENGFEFNAEKSTATGVVAADGSLVLNVYIDRKTITISFNTDGGTAVSALTGLYGTATGTPAETTKTGYTFAGWTPAVPATFPAADETITAKWTINNYTVTWVVDGETKAIDSYNYDAAIVAQADPAKDGYVFAGWAWTNEAGETVAAPSTMPAYNVTATATWANATDTAYTVEIYTMKVDGTYEVVSTTKYGETGADVTADYTVAEGFELGADSVTEGKIAADGSTVLKVYLNRKTYNITVNGETDDYLYGEEIAEPTAPTAPEGYEQDGWVDENGNPVEFPLTVDNDNPTEIKPNWSILSYTVTWTVEGVSDVVTYEYNAAIAAVTAPAKEGYRFVGWTDETGAFVNVPATMPAKDLAFTAVYEIVTNVVNYYVDGVLVETLSGEFGEAIATEISSYKVPTGYELSVWYTDAACENELAEGATIGTATTNLYAKTSAKTYDAIFMVDGEVYAKVPTVFDEEIEAPAAPTKEGYVFTGWTPAVEIMDEEGRTFTATWKEGDYTVTYKVAGEDDQVFGIALGAEFEIAADPYKEGYTFLGWSATENGEVIPYEEMPETMPAENLVYYAVFEVNEYTVTWVIDGAETVETYEFGAAITAPTAEKENYTFKHWSLTENGEAVTPETVMGTANLKYYAVFEADTYTVTWVIDGAETVDTLEVGEAIVAPAAEKENFTFLGWSLTEDGEIVAPETVMGTADLKYYAVFEADTYTVTWVIDGAETVETLAVGEAIVAPTAEKEGYIFKYWSLTEDGEEVTPETVMGTANLKYYAVFEEEVAELPIKLMPTEDYTGVIERYGEIESHNDGSADPELVYETEDFEEYYVYGFTGRRFREDDVYDYFYVQGNGYMELEYSELSGDYGTGAKIIVKDNDTDEVVEEFYVIIFGDLDGDAVISNDDASLFNLEVLSPTWSHRRTGTPYMIKAADLDLDGRANNDDAVLLNYVPLKSMSIDQTTGEAY